MRYDTEQVSFQNFDHACNLHPEARGLFLPKAWIQSAMPSCSCARLRRAAGLIPAASLLERTTQPAPGALCSPPYNPSLLAAVAASMQRHTAHHLRTRTMVQGGVPQTARVFSFPKTAFQVAHLDCSPCCSPGDPFPKNFRTYRDSTLHTAKA